MFDVVMWLCSMFVCLAFEDFDCDSIGYMYMCACFMRARTRVVRVHISDDGAIICVWLCIAPAGASTSTTGTIVHCASCAISQVNNKTRSHRGSGSGSGHICY